MLWNQPDTLFAGSVELVVCCATLLSIVIIWTCLARKVPAPLPAPIIEEQVFAMFHVSRLADFCHSIECRQRFLSVLAEMRFLLMVWFLFSWVKRVLDLQDPQT